jgi:hypothetical protein
MPALRQRPQRVLTQLQKAPMKPLLPAVLPALLPFTADAAPRVVCHTHYNGESQAHVAHPVATPYGVEGVTLGERFVFRVVFQDKPADIAAVKVFTSVLPDEGPAQPVHQATYRWPVPAAAAGRAGLHRPAAGVRAHLQRPPGILVRSRAGARR